MSKELELLKQIRRVDGNMSREQNQRYAELEQALTELEELKKRDTAMEPKLIDYTTPHYLCPSCNATISIEESIAFNKIFNVFCKYCGQRLDWSDGE